MQIPRFVGEFGYLNKEKEDANNQEHSWIHTRNGISNLAYGYRHSIRNSLFSRIRNLSTCNGICEKVYIQQALLVTDRNPVRLADYEANGGFT